MRVRLDETGALFLDGVPYGMNPCSTFQDWFHRKFGAEADGAEVWKAIDRPGWMMWLIVGRTSFGEEVKNLASVFAEMGNASVIDFQDPARCAAFRLAVPFALLAALFVENKEVWLEWRGAPVCYCSKSVPC